MSEDGRSDEARDVTAIAVEDLGRCAFAPVHRAMLDLAGSIRRGESGGKVWLVEHDPVLTAGRATQADEITGDVVSIERGGRVTWHGPGQLVVYPIVRLPERDAGAWLRALERFGVDVCDSFGLAAVASEDGTGVFVGGKKLASIGVALRHWINLHGIAINVDVAPDAFAGIRPCGRSPELMSDLSRALARRVTLDECKAAARKALPRLLGR
ncbi:MAG: lipoyl(octanoyl) transferase LipB [Planctomycetes bacterium]|nr:lipoyl(octanoyl) transferase LipB [Planctomycetota bacterium]